MTWQVYIMTTYISLNPVLWIRPKSALSLLASNQPLKDTYSAEINSLFGSPIFAYRPSLVAIPSTKETSLDRMPKHILRVGGE